MCNNPQLYDVSVAMHGMQTIPGSLFPKYYVGGCAVNTGFLISHSFYPLAKYARNIPTMLSYDKKEAVLVILLNVSRGSPLAAEYDRT